MFYFVCEFMGFIKKKCFSWNLFKFSKFKYELYFFFIIQILINLMKFKCYEFKFGRNYDFFVMKSLYYRFFC